MATPTLIGVTSGGAASGTTVTVAVPSGLADGDILIALIRGQGTATGTTPASATGFTAAHGQANGDRVHIIMYHVVTSAAGEPTSYTFNTNGSSGRIVASLSAWRSANTTSPIAGTSPTQAFSTTTEALNSFTIASASEDVAVINLFSDERTSGQSHIPTSTPSGYTTVANVQNTLDSSTTGSRTFIYSGTEPFTGSTTVPSATLVMPSGVSGARGSAIALRGVAGAPARTAEGIVTLSGVGTAAGGSVSVTATGGVTLSGVGNLGQLRTATGGVVLSGSASLSPRGFSSVAQFLSTPGATSAWRLGGGPFPQHSEYAGDRSVALGYGALEFSCGWTSDLVPFGLGTQYLDSIAGVSGNVDPTTMTWATLSSTYVNKNNPIATGVYQPFFKLEDALRKYTPTHVMIVDPKYGFDTIAKIDTMLDLCDLYGGPSKILIKFDSPTSATTLTTRAHARGYTCINYWGTDTTSLAAQQGNWDVLGMSYQADSTTWSAAKAYGKPVWAAIVPDQAGYNTAWTNSGGFNFANVSGVTSVAPVSAGVPAIGTITLGGVATTQTGRSAIGVVTLSGVGNLSPIGTATATGGVTLSGTATAVGKEVRTATGVVALSGAADGLASFTRTATSGITLSGTADIPTQVTRTALGTVLLAGLGDALPREFRVAVGTFLLSGVGAASLIPERTAEGTMSLGGYAVAFAGGGTMGTICYPDGADWSCSYDDAGIAALNPKVKARAEALAWSTLSALLGYRLSLCPSTIRPCVKGCSRQTWDEAPVGQGGAFSPYIRDGRWYNGCGCVTDCSCTMLSEVIMPTAVGAITEVRLDGMVMDPARYRVDNGNRLVRTDGGVWPACQDMASGTDRPGTFSVSYYPNLAPNDLMRYAAGLLAAEFYKACTGQACALPSGVTGITRAGMSIEIQTGLFSNGYTGIQEVDAIIRIYNPHGVKGPSRVLSPDSGRARKQTWSGPAGAPISGGFGVGPFGQTPFGQ